MKKEEAFPEVGKMQKNEKITDARILTKGKTSKPFVHKCNCPVSQIISSERCDKSYWREEVFPCFIIPFWMFSSSRLCAADICDIEL